MELSEGIRSMRKTDWQLGRGRSQRHLPWSTACEGRVAERRRNSSLSAFRTSEKGNRFTTRFTALGADKRTELPRTMERSEKC